MIHRNKREGKRNGIGGKFEPGEGPLDCVTREVQEEAGVTPTSLTQIGLIVQPKYRPGEDRLIRIYTCEAWTGDLKTENDEGSLHRVHKSEVLSKEGRADDSEWMPYTKILAPAGTEKFFQALCLYEDDTHISTTVTFPLLAPSPSHGTH